MKHGLDSAIEVHGSGQSRTCFRVNRLPLAYLMQTLPMRNLPHGLVGQHHRRVTWLNTRIGPRYQRHRRDLLIGQSEDYATFAVNKSTQSAAQVVFISFISMPNTRNSANSGASSGFRPRLENCGRFRRTCPPDLHMHSDQDAFSSLGPRSSMR